jgi:hypothetical protein
MENRKSETVRRAEIRKPMTQKWRKPDPAVIPELATRKPDPAATQDPAIQ